MERFNLKKWIFIDLLVILISFSFLQVKVDALTNKISKEGKHIVKVEFSRPIYKQYDGTNVVYLPSYTYSGLADGVSVEGTLVGTYNAIYPNDNIDITLSGIHLVGENKDNYELKLTGYTGRIHPNILKDFNENINLELDKGIIVENNYNLYLETRDIDTLINSKYTGFKEYDVVVNNHSNERINLNSKVKVAMKVDKSIMDKERLEIFVLDSKGNYKDLDYNYSNGIMNFELDNNDKIIFSTRNIEYNFIIIFSSILLISLCFIIIYRIKNSRA